MLAKIPRLLSPLRLQSAALLLWVLCNTVLSAHADTLTIAAASDLKFAMDNLAEEFKKSHPKDTLNLVYGSSGKFTTQITQGAPFDMFFSADAELVQDLAAKGLAGSPVTPYGIGRLVVWGKIGDASKFSLANLTDPAITRIAIADPVHAPYGKRAEQALRAAGIWEQVKPKLVYGQNIAETAQFVQTGNAQIGLIALALVLNMPASENTYWLLPASLHAPLQQAFIITARAKDKPLAQQFAQFISTAPAAEILQRYGFASGNEAPSTPHSHKGH